ncbi:MAG TPA: hypothetical protein DEF05_11995 [Erwinia sp.]|nr:hypothetical protein [Erwinia sp.]
MKTLCGLKKRQLFAPKAETKKTAFNGGFFTGPGKPPYQQVDGLFNTDMFNSLYICVLFLYVNRPYYLFCVQYLWPFSPP